MVARIPARESYEWLGAARPAVIWWAGILVGDLLADLRRSAQRGGVKMARPSVPLKDLPAGARKKLPAGARTKIENEDVVALAARILVTSSEGGDSLNTQRRALRRALKWVS